MKGLTIRDILGYGLLVLGVTFGVFALGIPKPALILSLTTIAIFGAAWAVKSVLSKEGTTTEARSSPGCLFAFMQVLTAVFGGTVLDTYYDPRNAEESPETSESSAPQKRPEEEKGEQSPEIRSGVIEDLKLFGIVLLIVCVGVPLLCLGIYVLMVVSRAELF